MAVLDLKKEEAEASQLNCDGLVSFNKTDLDVAELEHRLELAATIPGGDCWTNGCNTYGKCPTVG